MIGDEGKKGYGMQKRRVILTVLLSLLLTLGAFTAAVHADFGDFGGDYDYGGNDSYDYDFGNDYDYDDNDRDYDSGGRSVSVAPGAQATDPSTLRPISEYAQLDPQFSEAQMREKLSNLYVQFQNAWQAKDMEPLRPYLTDAMFGQCDRQLDAYRRDRQTNRIERISVLDVQLVGFKQQSGTDTLVARLKTRIVDYVVNDADGTVVRGSKTAEKFMEYEWDLVRSSGMQTGVSSGTKSQNCPQCGAPININRTAKCEYCGCILTTDTFDWAVSEIKGLSQRTVGN